MVQNIAEIFTGVVLSDFPVNLNFSSKSCLLVVPEISGLFINILAPDDKYSLSVKVGV